MEELKKIGVVILNYNTPQDTIRCCDSLINQKNVDLKIVIVDNNSSDNSIKEIQQYIDKNFYSKKIVLLTNKENLGFAKGNNVGISYLRNILNIDCVFVLNSDTLMSTEFVICSLLKEISDGVGIISPECRGFDKVSFQQPYCLSNGSYLSEIIKIVSLTIWQSLKAITRINYSFHKKKKKFFSYDYEYIIQGNAYILTPFFFNNYTSLFPNTFLYLEETALLWYIKKSNLRTKYVEGIVVFHKEAGSNKMSSSEKEAFKAREMRKSLWKILPLCLLSKDSIRKKFDK